MLNYKHLYYFREVAKAGSIARASDRLHITPQTISMQLGMLEEDLGTQLFHRRGRNLELSEAGQVALDYADEIFALGAEMRELLQHYPEGKAQLFRVGVSDLVPKSIAYKILEPAMTLAKPIHIICTEGKLPDLLGELAVHRMELVIADSPMPSTMNVKGFSHPLGASGISFFSTKEVKQALAGAFPQCLHQAPLLMPNEGAAIRTQLMRWFYDQNLEPKIVGEFDDSALMKAFGLAGRGIFTAPTVLADTLKNEGVELIGSPEEIWERFYAISVERRITHPAVRAITDQAQDWLKATVPLKQRKAKTFLNEEDL
ncbi:MAG: transcriptional activator NhaR [Thiofilum sp.]|uniref:transcriptional activator NhaR n=1 Tax=Thiofilum sp. TaxID=2212733 RepID=UPI0025FAA5EE|nr:transcriptional activator NhaR [Thiofilum sp.]MBK8453245.1 transcriptional activator NhaR [Thiofilum sp.]